MILISAGLVLTAVVLLIAGVVIAKPFLVMWSIAVSVLSAVFLVIGALLRRHELFPGGGRAGVAPPSPFKGPAPAGPMPVPPMTSHRQPAPGIPGVPAGPPEAAPQGARQTVAAATRPRPVPAAGSASARQGVPDAEAIVLVIPGRRRYHVAGCRQLADREHEELTHEEAREEGFTPCTTCLSELSGGIAPQDAPEGYEAAPAPAPPSQASRPTQALREPGPSGTTGPDSGETVRFTPPYRPAGTSGNQADRPRTPPGEPEAPLRESREQPASAPRSEKAAAPFAAPSFPLQMPSPAPAGEDSSATSWFSRDPASPPASRPGPGTDARPSEPGEQDALARGAAEQEAPEPTPGGETSGRRTAAEQDAPVRGTAEQDAPESGERVEAEPPPAGSGPLAESAEPVEPVEETTAEPSPAGPEPTAGSAVRSEPAEPTERAEPASAGSAEPGRPAGTGPAGETAGPENGGPETTGSETTGSGSETDGRPETEPAPAGSGPLAESAAPVDTARTAEPAEPVEPAGTEQPGRAGRPAPAGSTSAGPGEPVPPAPAESAVPDVTQDDDTSPHGIPAVKAGAAGSGTVKVISGTRRFHGVACPLVRGVDDDGIETMSRAEAEEAGLSGCAVCQGDVPDRG
ncbi:hypothetical protein Ppa06_04470 [Planomonospora parontospora subsp. parontospora]|uniref:Uncharacterized protein n=2 Tax=Planomonospora parontospora TaxID=58119 RepID=A0AA37BBQ2_9ACTN|nr:hypothetical protein [Planomonospora parontospora]GGK47905.1 hypothetical protein GCM10010126_04490 [Planomonospora parontospora]GII06649.1 hypothetical protein Ppa06_04470 [Planomonospora parontospora subsp. parontospora]